MSEHLFVISKDVFKAVSFDEVASTSKAMHELEIFYPPFMEFDITINASTYDVQKFLVPEWEDLSAKEENDLFPLVLRYEFEDKNSYYPLVASRFLKNKVFVSLQEASRIAKERDPNIDPIINEDELERTFASMYATLIVLLATKNINKDTTENKAAKLISRSRKRGSSYKYSGITTLNIGKITDTYKGVDPVSTVRPHLRRGHVRNQRFGEGLTESKKIFIQPVFVNADDGWIENQRKEYRVKL